MIYMECKTGDFVFHQGEEGSRFYVILSGSVAVLKVVRRKDGKPEYTQLAVLKAGTGFGELALINDQQRTASILCREPTYLAILERDEYKRILGRIDDARLEVKVQLLQKHPAFSNWGKAALQRVSYFFFDRTYKRKQVLFLSGQECSYIYFVKTGEFQLTIDVSQRRKTSRWTALATQRQQREVTLVGAGEVLGDSEALDGTAYLYTCTCYSAQGEVMQISKEDFLKRLVNDQSVESFKRLNAVKARVRKERLQKTSSIEAFFSPKLSLYSQNNHSDELLRGDSPIGALHTARKQLKVAIVKRWGNSFTPTSHAAVSPHHQFIPFAPDSGAASDRPANSARSSVTSRSWVEVARRKYFSKPQKAGVLFHQLKEPEDTLTPRYLHSQQVSMSRSPHRALISSNRC
jgi:CRP-like cAMP-binding protein